MSSQRSPTSSASEALPTLLQALIKKGKESFRLGAPLIQPTPTGSLWIPDDLGAAAGSNIQVKYIQSKAKAASAICTLLPLLPRGHGWPSYDSSRSSNSNSGSSYNNNNEALTLDVGCVPLAMVQCQNDPTFLKISNLKSSMIITITLIKNMHMHFIPCGGQPTHESVNAGPAQDCAAQRQLQRDRLGL